MVQQSSNQKNPREDEQFKQESQDLAKGGHFTDSGLWRDPDITSEDQPPVAYGHDPGLHEGTPAGMTPDDVEQRSEIARFLGVSSFPADSEGLMAAALGNHAPQWVSHRLRELPTGHRWENMQEVARALGIGTEHR